MKAAILTFHWAYNYGAVLQTYGLQEALTHMGVKTSVLDYRSPMLMRYNHPLGLRSGRFMTMLPMRWKFDRFRRRRLNLTGRLSTTDDLREVSSSYDVVIVGSDQVWNTNIIGGDLNYFLTFTEEVNRISYAADFGEFHQRPEAYSHIAGPLSKFNHISVRTELSRQIVRGICGRDVDIVLDPTLLFDFSEVNANVDVNMPYILVYSIWKGGATTDKIISVVTSIKSYYNLPVYSISQTYDFPLADVHFRGVGPEEWLAYFDKAAFVCTDSYHGFIFAIKNKKPFVAVCPNNRAARIVELAARYGLENHVVISEGAHYLEKSLTERIDYDYIHSQIKKDVEVCKRFLQQALSDYDNNRALSRSPSDSLPIDCIKEV